MQNIPLIKKVTRCRVCKENDFTKVLTFGPTPLANAFLTKEKVDGEEYFYPLDVYFCNNCKFLTLGHVVSPVALFKNYVYVSSTSQVFINHFKTFSKESPLSEEISSFVGLIENKEKINKSGLKMGLDVVRVLDACEKSMKLNGKIIKINLAPFFHRSIDLRRKKDNVHP